MDAKPSAADTVTAYWAAANARDWKTFGDLLAPDVVYEIPQSRERITGRERYVRFNAEYPGDGWVVEPIRVVGDGTAHGATWTRFLVGETEQTGLCFFDLDEHGLISHITDFWPVPYEPPPGREHLAERY
jgi:ketosteroid isomerase-like protein